MRPLANRMGGGPRGRAGAYSRIGMARRRVYCTCRGPDDGTTMVQCERCEEWYHTRCVGLSDAAVAALADGEYVCAACGGPGAQPASSDNGVGENANIGKREAIGQRVDGDKRGVSDMASADKGEATGTQSDSSDKEGSEIASIGKREATGKITLAHTGTTHDSQAGKKARTASADDSARATVREGILSALQIDGDPVPGRLAAAVEAALHAAHGGDSSSASYRQHYRMLVANLRDAKNGPLRASIVDGDVSPGELVAMDAAALANPEAAAERRRVERSAMAASIRVEERPADGGGPRPEALTSSAPADAPLSAVVPMREPDVRQSSIAASGLTMGDGQSSSLRPAEAVGWEGSVVVADAGLRRRLGGAALLGDSLGRGAAAVAPLLPVNVHVTGRIAAEAAQRYVSTVWAGSSSRGVCVLGMSDLGAVSFSGGSSGETRSEGISAHLSSAAGSSGERWAVAAHDASAGVRDAYVLPSSAAARLPALCVPPDEAARRWDVLLVLVYARDPRAPVPSDAAHADPEYDPAVGH